jgi:hypothetical protein
MDKEHEQNYLESLIKGKTVDEAKEILERGQYEMRIVSEDGEDFMGTMDWKPNRVNVAVVKNLVKSVVSLG